MSDPSATPRPVSAAGRLLGLLVETPGLDDLLNQTADLAAAVITPAAACGITVLHNGRPYTAATSDDLAPQLDQLQYDAGEGPCLDALATDIVVQVDDLSQEHRWDTFRPQALAHGMSSALAIPLVTNGERFGAMNLYASGPAAFEAPHRQHAEPFAAQAAAALSLGLRQIRHAQLLDQFAAAIASNSLIDQAIGILMGQQRCTAAAAFDLLRQASQHRNRKLRDIAADIITRVSGQAPQPRPALNIHPDETTNT